MTLWIWIGFIVFVLGMLALDLGVFNRKAHVIKIREAIAWTAFWVFLALLFNIGVYFMYEHHWLGLGVHVGHPLDGRAAALQYFTGYIIEKSLSLDNIFVIAMIFSYFRVPAIYQHRVLFWGILGALVMRAIMILAGAALIQRFDWVVYVLGALLIATAIKMLIVRHDTLTPDKNPLIRLAKRFYRVSHEYHGAQFFIRENGQRVVTPLFLALLLVESMDLLFAIDSIPAIFAITYDPFIVFTSNVFAILGLRSLYFALAGLMDKFRYLKVSLVFVLAFVGVKMLLSHRHPIPILVSLGVILGILSVGIIASWFVARRQNKHAESTSPDHQNQESLSKRTYHQIRRIVILIIGSTVVLAGLALTVLPGPAIVVVPVGLAILATEFLWAKKLLDRAKSGAGRMTHALGLDSYLPASSTDEEPSNEDTADKKP